MTLSSNGVERSERFAGTPFEKGNGGTSRDVARLCLELDSEEVVADDRVLEMEEQKLFTLEAKEMGTFVLS